MGFIFWSTILLGLSWWAFEAVKFGDYFKVVHNQTPGKCVTVKGIDHGSEDMDLLPSGVALITSGLTFKRENHLAHPGAIYSIDMNKNETEYTATPVKISGYKDKLNPHGLSVFTGADKKTYVYIVHHSFANENMTETVEKFSVDAKGTTLTYIKTIKDDSFQTLNDLTIIEEDKFYASNFMIFKNNFLQSFEQFSFLPLQNVIFFDGKNGSIVLNWLRASNGVNLSPDKKFLYVAEVFGKRITSYRINGPSDLKQVDRIFLGTMVDNINVDPDTGDLWLGTHPTGYQLFFAMLGKGYRAPSQVLRVQVSNGIFGETTQVYANNGNEISASSSALYHKGKVLVGSISDKTVLCECLAC